MAFQMIDGNERFVEGKCQSFGCHNADNHAADESGTRRSGNRIQIFQSDTGFADAAFNDFINMVKM